MVNKRFVLNKKGVRELLKSREMRTVIIRQGIELKNKAGLGYKGVNRTYRERLGYVIYPDTDEAKRDNADNDTLKRLV